jgi:hypothetical protein
MVPPIASARPQDFTATLPLGLQWHPSAAFEPLKAREKREARYGAWLEAVARVRSDVRSRASGAVAKLILRLSG